eukprot:TRINITY_DN11070_c0_g1_i3.p1 TRINITY_DN11070_c0_g1~~TRINITY_DN11070_c0_g1_i3.p1  ORF type:complete len:251 (-),score=-10.09 TRINITY_DN11070_c0_g1_i3:160-912(-)
MQQNTQHSQTDNILKNSSYKNLHVYIFVLLLLLQLNQLRFSAKIHQQNYYINLAKNGYYNLFLLKQLVRSNLFCAVSPLTKNLSTTSTILTNTLQNFLENPNTKQKYYDLKGQVVLNQIYLKYAQFLLINLVLSLSPKLFPKIALVLLRKSLSVAPQTLLQQFIQRKIKPFCRKLRPWNSEILSAKIINLRKLKSLSNYFQNINTARTLSYNTNCAYARTCKIFFFPIATLFLLTPHQKKTSLRVLVGVD